MADLIIPIILKMDLLKDFKNHNSSDENKCPSPDRSGILFYGFFCHKKRYSG
jgi:hypothetical protein